MGAGLVRCVWRRGRPVRSPVRCFGRLLARRLLGIVITLLSGTPQVQVSQSQSVPIRLRRCPSESIRALHRKSQFTASLSQCPPEAIRAHQRQPSHLAFQSGLIRGNHGSSEAIISPCFPSTHRLRSRQVRLTRLTRSFGASAPSWAIGEAPSWAIGEAPSWAIGEAECSMAQARA